MELNPDVDYLFKLSRLKVRAYLLHNGSASQSIKRLKPLGGGILKKKNVWWIRPETKWSNHVQIEEKGQLFGGSNPFLWQKNGMRYG